MIHSRKSRIFGNQTQVARLVPIYAQSLSRFNQNKYTKHGNNVSLSWMTDKSNLQSGTGNRPAKNHRSLSHAMHHYKIKTKYLHQQSMISHHDLIKRIPFRDNSSFKNKKFHLRDLNYKTFNHVNIKKDIEISSSPVQLNENEPLIIGKGIVKRVRYSDPARKLKNKIEKQNHP